jgi:hypothetical protein
MRPLNAYQLIAAVPLLAADLGGADSLLMATPGDDRAAAYMASNAERFTSPPNLCFWEPYQGIYLRAQQCGRAIDDSYDNNHRVVSAALRRYFGANADNQQKVDNSVDALEALDRRMFAERQSEYCKGADAQSSFDAVPFIFSEPLSRHLLDSMTRPSDPFSGSCL